MPKPHVRVYLDNDSTPVVDEELPAALNIDTRKLPDGPHRLIVRAADQSGTEGVEEIPFHVQNGPGIMVTGLSPGSTHRGNVHLKVDAFSSDDPFDPRYAEARSAIPTWVWVLFLAVIAWIIYYAATMYVVPAQYRNTPTFGPEPAASAPAASAPASTAAPTTPASSS
ncbi:MAG TPA: cytochrome C [Rhodanobacteraceae bacterium]|nr:cytochrome C [Rhodanobacteraceae bacterium]